MSIKYKIPVDFRDEELYNYSVNKNLMKGRRSNMVETFYNFKTMLHLAVNAIALVGPFRNAPVFR